MALPLPIICGSTYMSTTKSMGAFFCPACEYEGTYKEKEYQSFFHLFWIPIIPCGSPRNAVKCSRCKTKFEPNVLEYSKARALAKARGQAEIETKICILWHIAMLRVMVALMMADGEMNQSEINCIRVAFHVMTDGRGEVSESAIFAFVRDCSPNVEAALAPFVKIISNEEKQKVIKGLCLVAYADGELHSDERKLIDRAAKTLGVSTLRVGQELQTLQRKMQEARAAEAAKEAEKRNLPQIPDTLAKKIMEESGALSLKTLIASIDNYRRGKWDQRAAYIEFAVTHWADKTVTRSCPDSAVGNLFKGVLFIHRAWEARGSGLASTVPGQQVPVFFLCLKMAREAFLRAAEQDPEDPTPFAFLAGSVAKGLQVGKEQARKWFLAAVKRDPFNYKAHSGRLQNLCLKWGGSHEEMHAFAKETVRKAPPHSLLHTIQYQAFYEQWLYYNSIVNDTISAKKYLQNISVQKAILAIHKQVLENDPIKDIFKFGVHMQATEWLISSGEEEAAKLELNKLRPWSRLIKEDEDKLISMAMSDKQDMVFLHFRRR